jgi:uncharacterized membrane protein (DUF441 family)
MTLVTQTPPLSTNQSIHSVQKKSEKSIFASKTFWGIVFTTIAAIAPIVGEKIYERKFDAKDGAQIVVILCGAASAIVGRVDAGAVYTPKSFPGPNKSNFS